MITDILKEKTPDQKPRFFLHDEVKAWLLDNLEVTFQISPNQSTDYDLQNKLQQYGIYRPLVAGISVHSVVKIAGETLQIQGNTVSFMEHTEVIGMLLKTAEQQAAQIKQLGETQQYLIKRIETLENLSAV